MRSWQKKILDAMKATIETAGLEPVHQPQWANTGTLSAVDGFDTVACVRYDFQSAYCGLKFTGPGAEALGIVDGERGARADRGSLDGSVDYHGAARYYHLEYTDTPRLKQALSVLEDACSQVGA